MPNPDRSGRIGGSDVPALFGLDPWKSYYRLWHEKAGNIEPEDLSNNEDVEDGIYYEEPTARLFAKRNKLKLSSGGFHSSAEIDGFGGTTDFVIASETKDEKGILEVKNTGWRAYERWKRSGEPPMHYQLQLQAYMGLTGLKWGMLAIAVDRKLLPPFEYEFKPQAYEAIKRAVADFWQSIKEGKEPKQEDTDHRLQLIRKNLVDDAMDLSSDKDLNGLIMEYCDVSSSYYLTKSQYQIQGETVRKAKNNIEKYLFDKRINSNNVICGNVQLITKICPDAVVKEHTRKGKQKLTIKVYGETQDE